MSADTHTHIHQLMSYELVYTSIHSSIKSFLLAAESADRGEEPKTNGNYVIHVDCPA